MLLRMSRFAFVEGSKRLEKVTCSKPKPKECEILFVG